MCCQRVVTWATHALLLSLMLPACGPSTVAHVTSEPDAGMAGAAGEAGGTSTGVIELGVASGPDGLDFAPMTEGAVLNLETFGQGGTHVLLGVRSQGFGSRAFVALRARNLNTGVEVTAPAPARPQLWFCDAADCNLVPITLMLGGLTAPTEERNGLPIQIFVDVHNQAGVTGQDSRHAVLSTADL